MVDYRPDNILPAFNLGASIIPRTNTLSYLGVTFKLRGNLPVDFSERCMQKNLYHGVVFLDIKLMVMRMSFRIF